MINTEDGRLDQIDHAIVAELSRDGRLPVTTLAQRVGLSKTPCQNRLKKLIDDGVIVGFCAVVSPEKLRLEHVAFVEIKLSDTRESALAAFNAAAVVVPEVEQCHLIAGNFDYLLKVRTRDIQEYRAVLGEKISALPHVASTSTHVSMQAVKDKAF